MIREREYAAMSGWAALAVLVAAAALCLWQMVENIKADNDGLIAAWALGVALSLLFCVGLFMVSPNEGKVLQLFGRYIGTAKTPGLRYANPLYAKKRISMRVRNFESGHLKVNDLDGNPIEIGAVVVWKVVDTAEALFEVDNYENYVHVQTESALRNMATSYPYDAHDDEKISLRGHTASIADHLRKEIQDRLSRAGVDVVEARITHLAYAPEIASAMLRRQQAEAVIAARQKIVHGAVSMVDMALKELTEKSVVHLDDERRAAMVSNLMVVLCGEAEVHPIINTGTLYT